MPRLTTPIFRMNLLFAWSGDDYQHFHGSNLTSRQLA
jgi:hypothetical protein